MAGTGFSAPISDIINHIAAKVSEPSAHLGKLVILGNSTLDDAQILLLPEIHDDADSLLTQLLIVASEKRKPQKTMFLGESLPSLQKCPWELFSKKTMEILGAKSSQGPYSPRRFEENLSSITNKLRESPGQLDMGIHSGLWTLAAYSEESTPLWGWDLLDRRSLSDRNVQLVKTMTQALKTNDRVIVMLGARHVPELEYLTSLRLLCAGNDVKDMHEYFSVLEQKHGPKPKLAHGVGSTTPIYQYLATKKYAVVFDAKLYPRLARVFNARSKCVNIK